MHSIARIRRPRHVLPCEHRGCRSNAQHMCKTCGDLVCGQHGVAVSDQEAYCLKCGDAAGAAGVQHELFTSVRLQGKRPARDGLDQQRG